MSLYETKKCPKCKASFECKQGSISQCQCREINLTEKERVYINNKYVDCLCSKCLVIMQEDLKHSNGE